MAAISKNDKITMMEKIFYSIECVSNSQGRNLGCSVGFVITSKISSTQGIGLVRERLRYLTASLTNTNDNSSHRVVTTFANLQISK